MRLDPDYMMIGEVRDLFAAVAAFRGAMTGHGLWSTLHTNSAIGIVQRLSLLTDLGRARLGGYQRPLREDDKALDLMFDHDGSVWMAGIPRRDDLLRLQDLLRDQGHQLSVSAHRPR